MGFFRGPLPHPLLRGQARLAVVDRERSANYGELRGAHAFQQQHSFDAHGAVDATPRRLGHGDDLGRGRARLER